MVSYNYSTKITEHMAKAVLRAEAISTKHSIEICNMIRSLPLSKAKQMLTEVVSMKRAVPFKRFNDNVGHRKGMGPGRYPIKAASKILHLLKTVEANAQVKALDTEILEIKHICAHIASRPMRYGRHRGRVSKRTHVEIVVQESPQLKEKKPNKQKKVEEKKSEKKEEVKEQPKTDNKKEVKETKTEEKKEVKETKVEQNKTEVKEKVEEKKEVKEEKKETPKTEDKKPEVKEKVEEKKSEKKEEVKEQPKTEEKNQKESKNQDNSKKTEEVKK